MSFGVAAEEVSIEAGNGDCSHRGRRGSNLVETKTTAAPQVHLRQRPCRSGAARKMLNFMIIQTTSTTG